MAISNRRTSFSLLIALFVLLSGWPMRLQAQSEPQKQQLLNGLHILLLTRPGDPNVLIKLRIHSGAAFDIDGKSGLMSLLGDLLFPDPVTFEYFKDELNGRLAVTTDFDAIEVTLQGKATDYDRIVDTIRTAVISTALTPENVTKLRDAKIKVLMDKKLSPAEIADLTIRERLFGTFPYAKDPRGTPITLSRIERADLMLARDRFLSPNNATLVIIGGVDEKRAMRTLRQLLGGWRKSEEVVPASFRQPAAVDNRTLVADLPGVSTTEV